MFDNIAAISSGNVNQAISIIRISGPDAFNIIKKIFKGKVGKDKTITFGKIYDNSQLVDEVLISWFIGPNTFTGEDIVEINAHGGVINTNKILELVLANGARIADRGEFSRRSFLNGKMDLVKAEAINDLIMAKSESQANISVKQFDGHTSEMISNLKTKLLFIIATCETNIDYPEYDDVEQLTKEKLLPKLNEVKQEIEEIITASKKSRVLYEGVNVAIVGKPNAGKSSLLNALLNEEKAIVTDTPGTTRDVVEGFVQVDDLLLNLKDTAGIHLSENNIENMGIKKSLEQIKSADLVIHVIDSTQEMDKDDEVISDEAKGKTYLQVFNKSDLRNTLGLISISAKNNDLKNLYDAIKKSYGNLSVSDEKIIYNTRQLSLIKAALIAVNDAIVGLNSGMGPDVVIIDIQKAWDDLANILGKSDHEDLLDSMFKNFCLGK